MISSAITQSRPKNHMNSGQNKGETPHLRCSRACRWWPPHRRREKATEVAARTDQQKEKEKKKTKKWEWSWKQETSLKDNKTQVSPSIAAAQAAGERRKMKLKQDQESWWGWGRKWSGGSLRRTPVGGGRRKEESELSEGGSSGRLRMKWGMARVCGMGEKEDYIYII